MTETKNLFDAPWYVFSSSDDEITVIENESGRVLAELYDVKTANRLALLPELYDALMHYVVNDCPHAFISNDECRLCPDKKCKTREAVELLRKVRDGK